MSIHPEGKSYSDIGRVVVLKDPPAWMPSDRAYTEQGKEWGVGTYSVSAVVQHAISPLFEGDKQR